MHRHRLPYLLIPLAAFLAIAPLLTHGASCGHDFDFHLPTWFEAARQLAHGNLHPHWAYTPAYNAGEPRFVFYPPISWTIGAILGLIFPWTWTPILYTWLALTAAGLSLYYLAHEFTAPTAALFAAIIYIVNPYMLFTAYERTAYAELLAAAFIPLLLHAILRSDHNGGVTIPRIAIPVALLWLTNAPAAVMSCYTLALLTIVRILTNPGAPYLDSEMWASRASATAPAHSNPNTTPTQTPLQLALNTTAGTALGLGLAAFYILPAAYERRYVQIAMAIIPTMRFQDNFLFGHTTDIDHDRVLHTASLIAIILIALTAATLLFLRATNPGAPSATNPGGPSFAPFEKGGLSRASATAPTDLHRNQLFYPLIILTVAITLLLTPLTTIIWTHAPELAFLQFPWRFLAILEAILALATALAITRLHLKPIPTAALTLLLAAAFIYPEYTAFHQTCYPEDTVQARLALFRSNQGTDPTDEYTPINASNEALAQSNPPYWLATAPNAKAPASPTPHSRPGPAPSHLTVNVATPEDLILNLRNYPAWRITLNGTPVTARLQRTDGLISFPIPQGPSRIAITYTRTFDQTLGDIFTLISLALLVWLLLRTRHKISAT